MASKILLKLIDEAILPAVLIVSSKILSLAAIIYLFQIPWELSTTAFPTLAFTNPSNLIFVNSYSNMVVFISICAGLLWVLVRAHVFHDTHILPSLSIRLLSWDLTGLLTSSHEIFHKAVVWFGFLWLALLFLGLQVLFGVTYLWIFAAAIPATIFLTWLLIEDLERELAIEL